MADRDLQRRLQEFVEYRLQHLDGDEKGEAQVFLDRLFQAFGHEGTRQAGAHHEARIRKRDSRRVSFADLVWKKRLLLEMKKSGESIAKHYQQAFEYWLNLTPARTDFVVLCNFDEFWIYNFDEQLEEPVDRVAIEDLPTRWESLAFMLPEPLEPVFHNDLIKVTREAAATLVRVTNSMIDRGIERAVAQRFTMQAVVAMFGEDVGLLPTHPYTRALEDSTGAGSAYDLVFGLFREMDTPGVTPAGRYEGTPYFNGALFSTLDPIDLIIEEVAALHHAASFDWSAVRPEIFGTLFEQSMGEDARRALGAHFTSGADIQRVVLPTIVAPWRERIESASTQKELAAIENDLLAYRVLDPACGCGNFLYIAYRELRKLESSIEERRQAISQAKRVRTARLSLVDVNNFYGIDIDPFAVEIAKVTLMLGKQLAAMELGDVENPLPLDDLSDKIVADDALFMKWPKVDAIIGNPPYLGRRHIVPHRGATYAARLGEKFPDVGGVSDYVSYWFRLSHDNLPVHGRAGLVGTNTIRQGDTRKASLDYILNNGGEIVDAWSSIPWSGDAAVHVSIVNWTKTKTGEQPILRVGDDGNVERFEIPRIFASLENGIDVGPARDLEANKQPKRLFQGQTPGHTEGFVLSRREAKELRAKNPANSSVIYPYFDGREMLRLRHPERYVIDFDENDPALARAQAPDAFSRIERLVLPIRKENAENEARRNEEALADNPNARINRHHARFLDTWWKHSYRREAFLNAISDLDRYVAVPATASEDRIPVFTFLDSDIRPSHALQCLAADDDYSFGIVHSHLHEAWLRARCSTLEERLRYTTRTVFNSFPWPQNPTDSAVRAVVDAAKELLDFRQERLENQEVTLVELYDALRLPGRNPLRLLHQNLDDAVFAAYEFGPSDPLEQLLELNLETSNEEEAGGAVTPPGGQWIDNALRRKTDYRVTPAPE